MTEGRGSRLDYRNNSAHNILLGSRVLICVWKLHGSSVGRYRLVILEVFIGLRQNPEKRYQEVQHLIPAALNPYFPKILCQIANGIAFILKYLG
jgi:hypothetical protein